MGCAKVDRRILPRRGFSLLEVVITTAILTIFFAGMASAIMITRRAVPDASSGCSAALATSRAVERLAADLFYATSITTATATELVFTVADRNGDNTPETIRYAWSGKSGDPLTRQFNGGAAAIVAQDVREFQLAYDKRQSPLPASSTDGGELLLASSNVYYTFGDNQVTNTQLRGQYFQPTLPANTKTWKVTRVRFRACRDGATSGDTKVQLRLANGAWPGDYVLEEHSVAESMLSSSYQWVEVPFTSTSGLLPDNVLCLVLVGSSSYPTCDVQNQLGSSGQGNYSVSSNDGGQSWSGAGGWTFSFAVYGTANTPDPVSYRYLLTDVRCSLRTGPDAWSRMQTSIRVVNEPQVAGP